MVNGVSTKKLIAFGLVAFVAFFASHFAFYEYKYWVTKSTLDAESKAYEDQWRENIYKGNDQARETAKAFSDAIIRGQQEAEARFKQSEYK